MKWLKELLFGRQFTYHQRVRIVGGFYKGMKGKVLDEDAFFRTRYEVSIDELPNINRIKSIEGRHMEGEQ